jgi:mannose-6-phosphate isomerase-like protein (cupin superfamily)
MNLNLEKSAIENTNFRYVVADTPGMQLVLMALKPGEEIGLEVHPDTDQFFRIEEGHGEGVNGYERVALSPGASMLVRRGTSHNVRNTSLFKWMKLYTIYSPPHHPPGLVQKNKPQE